jgi:hypothetical protein
MNRSGRSGRSWGAALQALAARWITDLHRTAQGGTSLLRTRVVTLRVALFAVIGARLIKPGRFETPSRAASVEDYCENDERSCHLTPPPRRNIWQQVYRRQVEFGYRSPFVTIWTAVDRLNSPVGGRWRASASGSFSTDAAKRGGVGRADAPPAEPDERRDDLLLRRDLRRDRRQGPYERFGDRPDQGCGRVVRRVASSVEARVSPTASGRHTSFGHRLVHASSASM